MKLISTKLLIILGVTTLLPWVAPAQPTLSGLTLYRSDANGKWDGIYAWNSQKGGGTDAFNVYLFTNTISSPTFLTSGNTDASLNPNLTLSAGFNTIQFAGNTSVTGGYYAVNLYFNNDLVQNRITAVVTNNGLSSFSVVAAGVNTFGNPNTSQPSSGEISFSTGGYVVTLTSFQTTLPRPDLVGNYATGPDGTLDTAGSFTLNVTQVPEPTVVTFGLAALILGATWRRFHQG